MRDFISVHALATGPLAVSVASSPADDLKCNFIAAIREAMAEENLTPTDIARRMGTSRQHVCKILRPDRPCNLSFETIAALARAVRRRVQVIVVPESDPGLFSNGPEPFVET
ncbi:MAG: Helix-turn-helix domain [Verrucomicrobia bacterium]|nr:Helix-turn-helix domain [Verrucomicrobiota bacterium]